MENKDSILADLYALRAGLSVISENKDDVCKIQSQTNSKTYQLLDPFYDEVMQRYKFRGDNVKSYFDLEPDEPHSRERLELVSASSTDGCAFPCKDNFAFDYGEQTAFLKKTYTYIKKTHGAEFEEKLRSDEFKDNCNKELKECSDEVDDSTKHILSRIKSGTVRTVIGTVLLGLGLIAVVVSVLALSVNVWGIVGGAVLAILGLSLLITGVQNRKDCRKTMQNTIEFHSAFTERTAQLLKDAQSALAQVDSLRAQANEKIQPTQDVCESIYKTLVQEYGEILDPRDWQYLDLIIYYVETNRAIDLRDALLQLDRERQTQQIINAVKEATYVISKTIQTEMSALRSTISSGFSSLQKSINSGFAQLQAIGNTQLAVAKQQLNETQLSNSLMQKANATSEQLMHDISFMRTKLLY